MRLALYIGFIAIISGEGLYKFLKSDPNLQLIRDQLDKIKEPFIYARDKYYAHMDFDFDYAEVPEINFTIVEESFDSLLSVLNQISVTETWGLRGMPSQSLRLSLQNMIDLATKDKGEL